MLRLAAPTSSPVVSRVPTRPRRSASLPLRTIFVVALAGLLGAPVLADARITRIEISRVESPTFEGKSFGDVGQYEKLVGRVFGEIDPTAPRNAVIVDILLAQRNARGMVEYSADLYILKPLDSSRGNGRVFFEVNNRGRLLSFRQIHDVRSGGGDPTAAEDAGNGFLMRQGYTFVSSGWDVTARAGRDRLTISVPVATNPDGSTIVGPSLEEFVVDNDTTMTGNLTYPAATLDRLQASLTVRVHYTDSPTPIEAGGWEYADDRSIRLLPRGTPFRQGRLYELTYPARDPSVAGLGFAALSDVATFLRHGTSDVAGPVNPLADQIDNVYSFAISQPARFMRDFVYLGFNRDPNGERVFDGVLNWIGGASGGFFNYRFAQPFRTHRQHIGRWYPERQFPFASLVFHDPVTGRTDGRLRRCLEDNTCPKIFEANSANEYWVKAGSLLHTDTQGKDIPDPANVRSYLFSSLPHGVGIGPTGPGMCQQSRNPLGANAGLRALLIALDEWVSSGTEPPASRVPRRADGTLVPALPQSAVGFPHIPGVLYHGLMSTGDLFSYGPNLDEGILTTLPPVISGSPYPAFVPKTDADGNDVAGIRLPPVTVPLATYTGWAVRAAEFAGDDLCDAAGQQIAFARTRAERLAAGDPRRSIEERYDSDQQYVSAVAEAARELQRQRLLLGEDVERFTEEAEARTPILGR